MIAAAPAISGAVAPKMSLTSVIGYRLPLWFGLFCISAALHSAEIAITTLYPWKVTSIHLISERKREEGMGWDGMMNKTYS